MTAKLVLYNEDLSLSLTVVSDNPDLTKIGFVVKRAQVMSGQWILHSNAQYDPKSTGKCQVLTEGPLGITRLDFPAISCRYVRTFTAARYGVSIFQHVNFGGN